MKSLSPVVIGGGMLMLGISWMLPGFVGGENAWSDEMAKSSQEASMRYHKALIGTPSSFIRR